MRIKRNVNLNTKDDKSLIQIINEKLKKDKSMMMIRGKGEQEKYL